MTRDEFDALVRAAGPGATVSVDNSPRAHRVVARSARKFAEELYEVYASRWPDFYSAFPSENDFVRRFWPHFIMAARATLAKLLTSNLSEDLKAEIYDGLIRDQSLAASRRHVPQIELDI